MTDFKNALASCGLTHGVAAEMLGVSKSTVANWSSRMGTPAAATWGVLAALDAKMTEAARLPRDARSALVWPSDEVAAMVDARAILIGTDQPKKSRKDARD